MRSLRRKDDGQWREAVEQRVRLTEPKVRRRTSDAKSGLMLLGEWMADAVEK